MKGNSRQVSRTITASGRLTAGSIGKSSDSKRLTPGMNAVCQAGRKRTSWAGQRGPVKIAPVFSVVTCTAAQECLPPGRQQAGTLSNAPPHADKSGMASSTATAMCAEARRTLRNAPVCPWLQTEARVIRVEGDAGSYKEDVRGVRASTLACAAPVSGVSLYRSRSQPACRALPLECSTYSPRVA